MIFIHIPKTAGLSVLQATKLARHGHKPIRHVETNNGEYVFTVVRNPYDRAVSQYYYMRGNIENAAHSPYLDKVAQTPEVKKQKATWEKIRKNNPLLLSAGVNNFWIDHFGKKEAKCWAFFYPQTHFLTGKKPISERINKVLRYETLAEGWPRFAAKHGFDDLPHVNKSKLRTSPSWQDELTAESIAKIGEIYADDFEHLNYERIS